MNALTPASAMQEAAGSPAGRRQHSRLRLAVPAQVLTRAERLRACLCDLSQSGAGVEHGGALALGEDCLLRWLDFEAFGSVVWVRGDYAGIAFDEPLARQVLLTTRRRADHGLVPDEQKEILRRAREWYCGWQGS